MTPLAVLIGFLAVTIILIEVVIAVPGMIRSRSGKALAFLAFFVFPAIGGWAGFDRHMEQAKTTGFCLSCHIMEPYGRSLYVDDSTWIPAAHFHNNRVPRDNACFENALPESKWRRRRRGCG